jgi:hypothetical protein
VPVTPHAVNDLLREQEVDGVANPVAQQVVAF